MTVCPECRTKNDDVSNFCKKCGFLLAGSSFKEKRERVLGEQRKYPWVFISLVVITLVLGGLAFWIIHGRTTAHSKIATQQKVKHEEILEGIRH